MFTKLSQFLFPPSSGSVSGSRFHGASPPPVIWAPPQMGERLSEMEMRNAFSELRTAGSQPGQPLRALAQLVQMLREQADQEARECAARKQGNPDFCLGRMNGLDELLTHLQDLAGPQQKVSEEVKRWFGGG